jgi:hypothetical protein
MSLDGLREAGEWTSIIAPRTGPRQIVPRNLKLWTADRHDDLAEIVLAGATTNGSLEM